MKLQTQAKPYAANMNTSIKLRISNRTIEITNPDKILFPKNKITKLELVHYYQNIAPFMIPLIKDRPISMHRFPDGITHEGFFQKEASEYFPSWIKIEVLKKANGTVRHVICNNAVSLTYLASQACITPHIWQSTYKKPNIPNRMVFDLDPQTDDFKAVKNAATILRKALTDYKLTSYVMTTGSRGLHVVVPIKPSLSFDDVRAIARSIAQHLAEKYPDDFTTEMRKEKRGAKIFIDTMRNTYAHTTVAPYAVRALEGAPVATPLEWSELAGCPSSQAFTIKTILTRLSKKECPWENISRGAKSLAGLQKKLL
jgi:bifunctional non-homologous end joining protein LigD